MVEADTVVVQGPPELECGSLAAAAGLTEDDGRSQTGAGARATSGVVRGARVTRRQQRSQSSRLGGDRQNGVADVRAIGVAADEVVSGIREEVCVDAGEDVRGGGCGEAGDHVRLQGGDGGPQLQVGRAEGLSPLGDAVGLVDDEVGDGCAVEKVSGTARVQGLGVREDEARPVSRPRWVWGVGAAAERRADPGHVLSRAPSGQRLAGDAEIVETAFLVRYEGEERVYDHGDAGKQHGRQLEAQALPRAGRKNDELPITMVLELGHDRAAPGCADGGRLQHIRNDEPLVGKQIVDAETLTGRRAQWVGVAGRRRRVQRIGGECPFRCRLFSVFILPDAHIILYWSFARAACVFSTRFAFCGRFRAQCHMITA